MFLNTFTQKSFYQCTLATLISTSLIGTYAHAQTPEQISPQEKGIDTQNITPEQKTLDNLKRQAILDAQIKHSDQVLQESAAEELATMPKSVEISLNSTTDELYAYLEQDPAAFEDLLLRSIAGQNAQALKKLLPAYERYPAKDQSVIDWGYALIALRNGDTKTAVQKYREINARLPDIRLLRLQMASALYQNRQINAAKDELEKLLRDPNLPQTDRSEIQSYITAINRLEKWNYNANLSFVRDTNLEDASPVGTKISDGSNTLSNDKPHQKGTGLSYGAGANKKWSYDNGIFTSFSTDVSGTYYWDNKKYNDLYLIGSAGLGYQTATAEVELTPIISQSWYGGGSDNDKDEKIKAHTLSKGVRLSGSKWLNANLMYQHSTQYTNINYKKPYQYNDGEVYSMSNGLFFAPNTKQYYTVYWNISKKDGTRADNSYKRSGIHLSWNNTWDKGFTTLASVGVASKKYEGVNFVNIKRHNHEYNLGLSIWKRDFTILGLTPKLNINSRKTKSNFKLDDFSETNANIVLSTTF